MRNPKRLSVFFKHINWLHYLKKEVNLTNLSDIDNIMNNIYNRSLEIVVYWQNNPDMRISQILISLDIMENIPGIWYYKEELDILKDQHAKLTEEELSCFKYL